jgi:hypothetical protein
MVTNFVVNSGSVMSMSSSKRAKQIEAWHWAGSRQVNAQWVVIVIFH